MATPTKAKSTKKPPIVEAVKPESPTEQQLALVLEQHKKAMDAQLSLFGTSVTLSDSLSNTVITLATAFLGGTIIFIEKIVKGPINYFGLIWIGCSCIIATIGCNLYIRSRNIRAIQHELNRNYDQCNTLQRRTRSLSDFSYGSLLIGMVLITTFALLNVSNPNKLSEGVHSMTNQGNIRQENIRKDEGLAPSVLRTILNPPPIPSPPAPQPSNAQNTSTNTPAKSSK